jgi:neutral ceramidase
MVTWDIPDETPLGEHRIVHHGAVLAADGTLAPFTGTTREFKVV